MAPILSSDEAPRQGGGAAERGYERFTKD